MEELTKKYINNKIVGMRKDVKQSRVHTINKLTKNIKKLRLKKGTEKEKTKNERKATRCLEEVQIMKKIKDDEVSKYALLNEKCFHDVTNDVNECARVKALARIASHKVITKQVAELRTTFPTWKDTLPLLMESLGEKRRLKKKIIKPVEKAKRGKSESFISHEKSAVSLNAVQDPCKSKNEETKSIVNYEIGKIRLKNPSENIEDNGRTKSVNDVSEQHIPQKDSTTKSNTNWNKEGKLNDADKGAINTVSKKDKQCVDNFFLTTDDKEYISISGGNENDEPSDGSFHKITFNRIPLHDANCDSQKKIKKGNKRKNEILPKFEEEKIEQMHPSWQAKKKLQTIKQFVGKKIKFSS